MAPQPGTHTIPGPVGRLEAIYRRPEPSAGRAALVCHPHPLHGGTMHTKVVYRAAKAFGGLGFPTLRFNFRGVGTSEGDFADGIGEADDVRAAIDWLAGEHPDLPVVVAGFSFGSVVALPVGANDDRVTHLVGIGVPTDRFPFDVLADVTKPKLFIQGDWDEFGPLNKLTRELERVARPWELATVEGADHFFTDRLPDLEQAIVRFFA